MPFDLETQLFERAKAPNFVAWHAFFLEQPQYIPELVKLALSDKKHPVPAYSAWLLVHVAKASASIMAPFQDQLTEGLLLTNNHSIQRSILVVLLELPQKRKFKGELLDCCFRIFSDPDKEVANRVYALYHLKRFLREYPEIDQEVIGSLINLAGTVYGTYDQSAVSGQANFVGDQHAALAIMINSVANTIAQRTRRGAGNFAVVSPTALTILQSATTSAFARTTEGTFEAPTNTKFVGTLNNAMKVYVNSYAQDATDVLIGYKGGSESDAPAFYCPYIPLMSSGVVLDPSTFEPVVSFMTRYGYVELSNTASSLGNAADYLGRVAITSGNVKFS